MTKGLFGLGIVGLAAALAAQPAVAREKTIEIRYSDLNLASEEGREVLDRRLNGAVRQICGTNKAPGVGENQDVRGCRTATLAQAKSMRDELFARLDKSGEPLLVARVDPAAQPRR